MNKCIVMGRLTRDPEITVTANAKIARYTLAVDRPARAGAERQADFISCVAFNNGADFAERYLQKGTKLLVTGRIQTGSYTNKDGKKVYTTDVITESQEFVEPKNAGGEAPRDEATEKPEPRAKQTTMDDFMPIPDDLADEGLPFN